MNVNKDMSLKYYKKSNVCYFSLILVDPTNLVWGLMFYLLLHHVRPLLKYTNYSDIKLEQPCLIVRADNLGGLEISVCSPKRLLSDYPL